MNQTSPRSRADWWPLAVILLLAVLMRVGYLPGLGYSPDLYSFSGWIKTIQQVGFLRFYAVEPMRTYPPIAMATQAVVGIIQHVTGLDMDPMKDATFVTLLKLPPALAELALIVLAYAWLQTANESESRLLGKRWLRWIVPGLLAVHPGLIASSAWWGQNESIFTLFLVATLIALNRDRSWIAWLCFALALLSKQESIMLAPLLAVLTLRRYGWRTTFGSMFLCGALTALVLAPFALVSGVDRALSPYLGAADRFPDVSNNAYNLWRLLIIPGRLAGLWPDGSPYADTVAILGPITLKQVGLALLGVVALVILVHAGLRKQDRREFVWAAALYCAVFLLPTQIHERYLYPGAVLIVIAVAQDRRLWWVALGILYTFANNIWQVAAPITFLGITFWHVDVSLQVALLNLVLLAEQLRVMLTSKYTGVETASIRRIPILAIGMRAATALVVVSLVAGLVADATTKSALAQWLADNVPDGARLGADGQAEEIITLTRQYPNARAWDWQLPWNTDEKPIVQWQGEGVRYLLIDERTFEHESLGHRVQRLIAQGAVMIYQTSAVPGFGTRQAVIALEKK